MFQIPVKANLGKHFESCMSYLQLARKEHAELIAKSDDLVTVTAERYACGLPVPSFQRHLVWTQEQQIKFIESAWRGIPLGSFMIHRMDWERGGKALPFSGWVIDGQQRLTAIDAYWNNEFPVYGSLWSDVPRRDQRAFLNTKFPHYEVVVKDEDEIKELYLLMAFGGVAHTEADRQHALSPASLKESL